VNGPSCKDCLHRHLLSHHPVPSNRVNSAAAGLKPTPCQVLVATQHIRADGPSPPPVHLPGSRILATLPVVCRGAGRTFQRYWTAHRAPVRARPSLSAPARSRTTTAGSHMLVGGLATGALRDRPHDGGRGGDWNIVAAICSGVYKPASQSLAARTWNERGDVQRRYSPLTPSVRRARTPRHGGCGDPGGLTSGLKMGAEAGRRQHVDRHQGGGRHVA
jgi:hypothetical protein